MYLDYKLRVRHANRANGRDVKTQQEPSLNSTDGKKKKCNVFKEVNKSSVRQRHIQNDRWRGWETYKQYISPGRFKPSGCGMQLDELWHWS